MHRLFRVLASRIAFAASPIFWMPTNAATLVLDNFAAPTPAQSVVAPSQQYVQFTQGSYAGVAQQWRDAYYWLYQAPAGSVATATVGAGSLDVAVGAQAFGELGLGYGAYGLNPGNPNAQGPLLGLDLRQYIGFQATFASAATETNLIVGLYTSAPTGGLSFWTGEINVAPAVASGPVVGTFLFNDPTAAQFNFSQVDGVVFIVDRAANVPGDSYSLSQLTFIDAVPEPPAGLILICGLGVLAVLRRVKTRGEPTAAIAARTR